VKCLKFISKQLTIFDITELRNSRVRILIVVYQFNEDTGEFEEVEIKENVPLFELLDSSKILIFVDGHSKRVWIWEGQNTSTRTKFICAQEASKVRDKHDISYAISSVNDGDETVAFKVFIGLV
jgi:hypothetical protein